MAVQINPRSYLRFTPLLESSSVEFWDIPEIEEIPLQTDDTRFEVDDLHENRPDLIADTVYGDAELWWVVMVANSLELPTQLRRGNILRIPSPRFVFTELLR